MAVGQCPPHRIKACRLRGRVREEAHLGAPLRRQAVLEHIFGHSDSKRGPHSQRLDNKLRFQTVVTTMLTRAMDNHNIPLLAAADCDFGVTRARGHAVLDHRKRGLAVLPAKGAGRAKSRFGLAQTHPQEGEIARGTETLATARGDVAFVLAAREIAQGCFAPLPAARHVALTSNEEALSAFLLA